jgi:hypothetical protein
MRSFQVDDPEQAAAIAHRKRGATVARDPVAHFLEITRDFPAPLFHECGNCLGCALAQFTSFKIDTAHASVSRERNETGCVFGNVTAAQPVFFLGEHHY